MSKENSKNTQADKPAAERELSEEARADEDEGQGAAKKASLAVFILVALLFAAVMSVTYVFELKFGKTAGTIALIVIAV